jgi:hypothetical protein
MGISRLKWSGILLVMGVMAGFMGSRSLHSAPLDAKREGEALGAGFIAIICYVGSAAFAIQHFRHRHDYDDEDHYE